MTIAAGIRISWADLPIRVRQGVESILGDTVVEAAGQVGGFSPGTADRIRTQRGHRAFVKAVSKELNSDTVDLHRKEAKITSALGLGFPTAQLLGVYDNGEWVALVLTDIDGHQPRMPWSSDDLTVVLDALLEVARKPVPPALFDLPRAVDELSYAFGGWSRLRVSPTDHLDSWTTSNLGQLEALADAARAALNGESLVHLDVRADNILIDGNGKAHLVDWPSACVGPGWLDALTLLVNVRTFDSSFPVDEVLADHPVFASLDATTVDEVVSGLAAYFMDVSRKPAPPGLPTVRRFQRLQGEAATHWLRRRIG